MDLNVLKVFDRKINHAELMLYSNYKNKKLSIFEI